MSRFGGEYKFPDELEEEKNVQEVNIQIEGDDDVEVKIVDDTPQGDHFAAPPLDETRFADFFNYINQDLSSAIYLYISLYRFRDYFNPFTRDSVNFNEIIKFYKKLIYYIRKFFSKQSPSSVLLR